MTRDSHSHAVDSPARTAFYLIYPISGMLAGALLGFFTDALAPILSLILPSSRSDLPTHYLPLFGAMWGFGVGLIVITGKNKPLSEFTNSTTILRKGLIWGLDFGSVAGLIFLVDHLMEAFGTGLSIIMGAVIGAFLGGIWGLFWGALLQIAIKMNILPSNHDGKRSGAEYSQMTSIEPIDLDVQFLKRVNNETSLNTLLEGVGLTDPNIAFDVINFIATEQEARATLLLCKGSNVSNEEVIELVQAIKHAM